jgi:S-adenosylmethionine hydrolase
VVNVAVYCNKGANSAPHSLAERALIALFTDFGLNGPYTGQVKAVLLSETPGIDIIDLFADAPAYDPQASAYLLAAYAAELPTGTVFLCVVDPGVGSDRAACVVYSMGCWFVGPDNGLFEIVIRRAPAVVRCWQIDWTPHRLSATFHGRDVFAPIAARLARGETSPGRPVVADVVRRREWPDDLARTVYIDRYGNVMTGIRAGGLPPTATVVVNGTGLRRARTFSDVPEGQPFWYENANGLLEIAMNMERVADCLDIRVGMPVTVEW